VKAKVYVETSILSYLAARSSRDTITAARQVITRRWWETERAKYDLMVSEVVEAECQRGDPAVVARRQELLREVTLFPVNESILEVARLLIAPGAIPAKAGPDAIHIAAAAVEECDFLLTWNFRHIANVRIRREVERILANRGFTKTTICTPEELV
jgi:predicted nucleic acid-binding protein